MHDRQRRRPRSRLAPGVRVSDRGDRALQVGLHPDRRLVLEDSPATRELLERLRGGLDPATLPPAQGALLRALERAGLLVDPTASAPPARLVGVDAGEPGRGLLVRLLADAGLGVAATDAAAPPLTLVLRTGAEPRREDLDLLVQADRPHLLLAVVAGRVRLGPTVVPGVTACLRCVDEHLTDRDPRHPLVVHQHLDRDPTDVGEPAELQLGLAWAVRDAAAYLRGRRPATWSTTVELTDAGPVHHRWSRHPRCGCAWGDALSPAG